jgi:hypothetical protein
VQLPGISGPDLQARFIADGYCIAIIFATGFTTKEWDASKVPSPILLKLVNFLSRRINIGPGARSVIGLPLAEIERARQGFPQYFENNRG